MTAAALHYDITGRPPQPNGDAAKSIQREERLCYGCLLVGGFCPFNARLSNAPDIFLYLIYGFAKPVSTSGVVPK